MQYSSHIAVKLYRGPKSYCTKTRFWAISVTAESCQWHRDRLTRCDIHVIYSHLAHRWFAVFLRYRTPL